MVLLAEARGLAFALLTPPLFSLVRRNLDSSRGSFWSLGIYLVALPPFMLSYATIHWLILPPWDPTRQGYVPRAGHSPLEIIRSGFADQITMYIAIVAMAYAYVYIERSRKQELERHEFQRALAISELQALKMQLRPHFLFNTLHGIATLIESDRGTARSMILRLSNLLRSALESGRSDLVTLEEETRFSREYLDLEKMRFGERLQIEWLVEEQAMQMLVPQMILQPLVENAIRYGIASSRERGWIEISAYRNNGSVEIRVRNSVGKSASRGTGLGLKNTEARLGYLYSNEASFSFVLSSDHIATAKVVVPALCAGLNHHSASAEPSRKEDSPRAYINR